ncbi:MAG: TonB-dependent receptor [Bacteroidetes bacterium]|nr:TonB-dependent receptor [Bacteroidota bacterium]
MLKHLLDQKIRNNRIELYSKTGMVFPEKPNKSMGLQQDFVYHEFNSFIGKKSYDAKQYSYLANYIFQNEIFNCSHLFKTGASFRYMNILDFYTDQLSAFSIAKPEIIPGAFLEYRYNSEEKFAVIAGTRFDYHNQFKELFTGRLNIKYNFTENLIVRAAGGNSYRTANIITDNIGWMAQGKALRIDETPRIEHGINYGLNATYKFLIGQQEATFNLDAYRSEFINQVIADAFSNNDYIRFYNLDGRSYAQSISAILDFSIVRNLQLRMAYKFDDVHITFNRTLYQRPLLSRHKGLFTLAYETINKKWRADYTVQLDGPKLLPLDVHHADSEIPFNQSPAYAVMNAQVTKVFKRFELYLGMENIGNFTQHHLIIGADNPFNTSFDATQIWGPIMGRRLYGGLRLKIF